MAVRQKIPGVGGAIRECRLKAGLSQDKLADRMDVATSFISMLESGQRYPSIEMIIRLAIAMDMQPGDILNRIAEGYTPSDACYPYGRGRQWP